MTHHHHCPYCYEAFSCEMSCTIEPDLEDRGRSFGSHAICHNVACHIDRAIRKYNESYERRQREALRRLQAPPEDIKFNLQNMRRRPIA